MKISSPFILARQIFLIPALLAFTLVMALAAVTETAYAGPHKYFSHGGYTGPGPSLLTVSQVSSMPNKVWVTLRGSISQALDYKHYMFTDSTGTLMVKIAPEAWWGQQVSSSDTLEIHGKIKRDKRNWEYVRVDVKRIIKQ